MADTDFVGRQEYIDRILDPAARFGAFFDIEGIPGIGKTRLIEQLAAKVREQQGVAVIFARTDFGGRGREFEEAAEFRRFRRMLQDALDGLSKAEQTHTEINEIRLYLRGKSQQLMRAGTANRPFPVSQQTGNGIQNPGQLIELATDATTRLARNLAARTQPVRLLILLDDFHVLTGRRLGEWVMELLAGIKGADVVVTHEPFNDPHRAGIPAGAVRLPLENLDRDDVRDYLASRPGIAWDATKLLDEVLDFTGGHPQALALVADYIKESTSAQESVRLIRQLGAVQGGRTTQLEELVDRILEAIDDEELRDTVYSLCVTRHFDGPLLQVLLDVNQRHAQTLLDRLVRYSFVRPNAVEPSLLTISDFVRRIGEMHLGVVRTEEIHLRAKGYYQARVVGIIDDDTSYESWYWLEMPAFQALERDWLYHISRLTEGNRQTGRLGIARVFLDAFWWWGYYIPFPFCEEILADWSEVTSSNESDRAWGRQLRAFYDNYPKGWRKSEASRDKWIKVRRALRYLWDEAHFDDEPTEREMRHIRGILALFLADAARYPDPGDVEADNQLDDAARQFAANKDRWNAAWTDYTRADLAVMRGQDELAISSAKQCAQAYTELDDHELLANLHRVCGDALWPKADDQRAAKDPGPALDAYARAVAHTYKFQVKGTPDDYTDAFQQEMIERSIERLMALRTDNREALRSACVRIRAFFGPYWQAVGADPAPRAGLEAIRALDEERRADVALALFPATPTIADLRIHDSEYALVCKDVTYTMRDELAKPPGAPLPSAAEPPAER
jgi:hypothetical protein